MNETDVEIIRWSIFAGRSRLYDAARADALRAFAAGEFQDFAEMEASLPDEPKYVSDDELAEQMGRRYALAQCIRDRVESHGSTWATDVRAKWLADAAACEEGLPSDKLRKEWADARSPMVPSKEVVK